MGSRDCPSGYSWYVCQANQFRGCCAVDPCHLDACPSEPPTGDKPIPDPVTTTTGNSKTWATMTRMPLTTTVITGSAPTGTNTADGEGQQDHGHTVTTTVGLGEAPSTAPTSSPSSVVDSHNAGAGDNQVSGGLPTGTIIGIIVGVVVLCVCIFAALWYFIARRRVSRDQDGRKRESSVVLDSDGRDGGVAWFIGGPESPGGDRYPKAGGAAAFVGSNVGPGSGGKGTPSSYPSAGPGAWSRKLNPQGRRSLGGGTSGGRRESHQPAVTYRQMARVPQGHPDPNKPLGSQGQAQAHPETRWESPDDVKCTTAASPIPSRLSKANSDMVSPVSAGGSSGDSNNLADNPPTVVDWGWRNNDGKSTNNSAPKLDVVNPWKPTVPAYVTSQPPSYPHIFHRNQPQQLDSQPKFELDGKEIGFPTQTKEVCESPQPDAGPGGLRLPPLRLSPKHGGKRTASSQATLARSASESGLATTMGTGATYPSLSSSPGRNRPPRTHSCRRHARSVSLYGHERVGDELYHSYRHNNSDGGHHQQHRATLRATRDEVEKGVHAGSWSLLSPAAAV